MHNIEPYLLIPFAIMLLSIAILPLVAPRFWGKNINNLLNNNDKTLNAYIDPNMDVRSY